MRHAASTSDEQRAGRGSAQFTRGLPELRQRPIRNPDDYQIDLPEWLRQCIANVPPGAPGGTLAMHCRNHSGKSI